MKGNTYTVQYTVVHSMSGVRFYNPYNPCTVKNQILVRKIVYFKHYLNI